MSFLPLFLIAVGVFADAFVGGKMLWEAFSSHEDTEKTVDSIDVRELLALAVATSIDALAVGISFAFLPEVPII